MSQRRFCPNCGAEVPTGAEFCTECGAQLEASPASTALAYSQPSAQPVPQEPQPYSQPPTEPVQSVSNIWYAVPAVLGLLIALLGLIAGVVLYYMFRKKNPAKAKNILIFSVIWTVLMYILVFII